MAYQAVNAVVLQCNPQLSAAEAHGVAAGMLCVNGKVLSRYWLDELLGGVVPVTEDGGQLLQGLFEETRRLLVEEEFEFDLLLPADDEVLDDRVAALKNWCVGFLYGVGTVNVNAVNSAQIREVLQDIAEITKLDSTASDDEENEQAYTEITEYLRAAVLVLRDEFWGNTQVKIH